MSVTGSYSEDEPLSGAVAAILSGVLSIEDISSLSETMAKYRLQRVVPSSFALRRIRGADGPVTLR